MRWKVAIGICVLTLIYAACLLWWVSLDGVLASVARVSTGSLSLALAFVFLAHVLALWRLGSVLSALGYRTDWRSLLLAFSAGGVANQFLNVFGQSLSRAALLARAGVPFSATVAGTYIERILAAGVLLLFSLVALLILFNRIAIDERSAAAFVSTMLAIAITAAVVAITLYGRDILQSIGRAARWSSRFWSPIVLTICIHAMGMGAYVSLLSSIDSISVSWSLLAAITIVTLVTSLPISFAGFGLRELSAVGALSLVGINPDVSFSVALLIGLLYITVTGAIGAVGLLLLVLNRRADDGPRQEPTASAVEQTRLDNQMVKSLALICAILVFFRLQSQVTNSDVLVNMNIADIVVCIALSIIILMVGVRRLSGLFPLPIVLAVAGLTAAIAWGLLVSYVGSNLGNWAYYTRGVGWLLMIGYASLGAAYAKLSDEEGRVLILKGLPLVVATICAIQLALLAISTWVYPLPGYIISTPLGGYANSPNTFSFDLAAALLLLIAGRLRGLYERQSAEYWTMCAIIIVTTYFTNARTGAVFVALVAAFDVLLRFVSSRRIGFFRHPALAAGAIMLVLAVVVSAVHLRSQETATSAPPATSGEPIAADNLPRYSPNRSLFERFMQTQRSDVERWKTIVAGLDFWQEHPVFGAGIGAYYESLRRQAAEPQGIHSIFIWFLGEMGALGAVALLAALAVMAVQGVRMMQSPAKRTWGALLLGSLMLIVVGGLVQDFFYQRIFWFVLGLAVAAGVEEKPDPISDRIYLGSTLCFGLLLIALTL